MCLLNCPPEGEEQPATTAATASPASPTAAASAAAAPAAGAAADQRQDHRGRAAAAAAGAEPLRHGRRRRPQPAGHAPQEEGQVHPRPRRGWTAQEQEWISLPPISSEITPQIFKIGLNKTKQALKRVWQKRDMGIHLRSNPRHPAYHPPRSPSHKPHKYPKKKKHYKKPSKAPPLPGRNISLLLLTLSTDTESYITLQICNVKVETAMGGSTDHRRKRTCRRTGR